MSITDIRDRFAGRRANRKHGISGSRDLLDRVHAEPSPPPAWRRLLAEHFPIRENAQWLNFRMYPVQDAIDPVTRTKLVPVWVLYTMTPAHLITDASKLAQLQDKPWWELPKDQQYGRRMVCSSYQWEMFRQFQCWARPYWCLQGTQGGTPMMYTPYEAALLRAHGLPRDVPNPGSLPYAEFDRRAVHAILSRDRMRQRGDQFSRLADPQKALADVIAEDEAAEMVYRDEFVKWHCERVAPNADFIEWHTKKAGQEADFKPATPAEEKAAAIWADHFREHGVVPAAMPET